MPVIGIGNNTTFQNNPFGTPDSTFTDIEDIYLSESIPDFNTNAEANNAVGLAGGDNNNTLVRAGALSNIPAGSTINEARVYFWGGPGFGSINVNAHAVLRDWTRLGATWNSFSSGNSWTTPGARGFGTDVETTPDDSVNVNSGNTWIAFDVTTITQDIVNGTITNNGALFNPTGPADSGFRFFGKALTAPDGERAEWVVDYSAASGTVGTLDETLDNTQVSGAGEIPTQGGVNVTLAQMFSDTAAEVSFSGLLSEILDNMSSSAEGTVSAPAGTSGSLSENLDNSSLSSSGLVWGLAIFNGIPPDVNTTETFYELVVNDLGFTPEISDQLHYTPEPGLTVDGQWVPTVDPAQDISGEYYVVDSSSATTFPRQSFTIDQRRSADSNIDLDSVISSSSGNVSSLTISGTLSETLDSSSTVSSGTVRLEGQLSETLDLNQLTSSGSVGTLPGISGSLSETLESTVLSSLGLVTGNVGFIDETLESVSVSSSAIITINGEISQTLENVSITVSGAVADTTGDLSEVLDNLVVASTGSLANPGSLSITLVDLGVTSSGNVSLPAVEGSLSESLDNASSDSSGIIIQPISGQLNSVLIELESNISATAGQVISGTLSEMLSNTTLSGSGIIVNAFIQCIVDEMIECWLPPNNVISETQIYKIVEQIATQVGIEEENKPEIMCKALEAVAYANKAKATTSFGVIKEKVDRAEYWFDSNDKSPADLWQDYIDSLVDVCPLFGYSKPTTIGIVVSPGLKIDPLKRCRDLKGYKR